MRRRVNVGEPFDIEACVIEAAAQPSAQKVAKRVQVGEPLEGCLRFLNPIVLDTVTRAGLVAYTLVVATTFLAVAGIYGLCTGNFVPIAAVWSVVGPLYAGMAAYYFGPRRK